MPEPQEVGGLLPSSSPKVTPVPLAEMSERTREHLSRTNLAQVGEPLAVFGTLARHPKLLAAWLPFAGRLLAGGTLERRFTELIILRVASNMGSDYELGQHVAICTDLGIKREAMERVLVGPSADGWSLLESLLLRATDELHSERQITDATWDALAVHLNEQQLIELCFLVGQYEMLAMFLRTAGVQLELGKEPLPRDVRS